MSQIQTHAVDPVMAIPTDPTPRLFDVRHAPMAIGILALVSLLAFEALAVNTAMPVVMAALQATHWYPLVFAAAMAGALLGMVLGGQQSDRHDPGRPLRWGLGIFVIGLLLAGLAQSVGSLVVGRLLQGFGSGLQAVALYAFVGRALPPALHPRMFGLFAAAWVVPALVGPLLTGLIVDLAGWRWVFLAVPPLALPCLWLLWPALQRVRVEQAVQARTEAAGSAMYWAALASLGTLLLPWSERWWQGWGQLPVVLLLVLSARALLPRGSLRLRPGIPSVVALRGLIAAAFASIEIYLPLLLQAQQRWSPTQAGLALSVGALSWAAGSHWQARHAQSYPEHWGLVAGVGLMAIGLLPLLAVAAGAAAAWSLPGMLLCGLGIGSVFPRLSVLVLALSEPDAQGRSASALQLADALLTAMVTALAGLLFSRWVGTNPALAFQMVLGVALLLVLVALPAGWRGARELA
ncbi:MAG: MFS transporter [Xanthomonadales bacterium]|nr:MFS transporter [Xanthomonadales bacterium]